MTPRITPLGRDELHNDTLATLRRAFPRADKYLDDGDAPPMPPILGLLGRHVGLTGPWLRYNAALFEHGLLDARTRELLILATARRTGSSYVWREHVAMATAAGLRADEIERLAAGMDLASTPLDDALLRAVDELIAEHVVGDDTWRVLTHHFDERELLEMLFVVGTYACLVMVLNSAGLHAVPDGREENPS
jgi:4-carboxymuconolactone decarboxylase